MILIGVRLLCLNAFCFGKQLFVPVFKQRMLKQSPTVNFHARLIEIVVGEGDACSDTLGAGDDIGIQGDDGSGIGSHVLFQE